MTGVQSNLSLRSSCININNITFGFPDYTRSARKLLCKKIVKQSYLSGSDLQIPTIMAILTSFPGLDVDITVNGHALSEYDPPPDSHEKLTDPATSIKYIEAQPGQEFGVRLCLGRQFRYLKNDISFKVILDGNMKRRWTLEKEFHADGFTFTTDSVKRSVGDQVVSRDLVFSTLTTGTFLLEHSDHNTFKIKRGPPSTWARRGSGQRDGSDCCEATSNQNSWSRKQTQKIYPKR